MTIGVVALGALLGLFSSTVGPERGTDRRTERGHLVTDRVTFRSGGVDCVGHWYRHATAGVRSCVVLCTGFTGTQDTPSVVATAEAFAAAG